MFGFSIPILHVRRIATAREFYCRKLDFTETFSYQFDPEVPDPCYLGLGRDNVRLHVSSFAEDSVSGVAVFIGVDDVDELYSEFIDKGVDVELKPTNQTWGNREMYVRDPDGNALRFVSQPK